MIGTFLLAALLVAPAIAQEQPRLTFLQLAAHYARYGGDCAETVVIEHAQSLPLPVKTAQGLRYRQMYYPAIPEAGTPLNNAVYAPSSVVQFDESGAEVTCKVDVGFPKAGFMEALGLQLSSEASKMKRADYEAGGAKYYAALKAVAAAFDAGERDAAAHAAAAEFEARFKTLSEPGLQRHYRALSPGFWEWLEALKKK